MFRLRQSIRDPRLKAPIKWLATFLSSLDRLQQRPVTSKIAIRIMTLQTCARPVSILPENKLIIRELSRIEDLQRKSVKEADITKKTMTIQINLKYQKSSASNQRLWNSKIIAHSFNCTCQINFRKMALAIILHPHSWSPITLEYNRQEFQQSVIFSLIEP